MLDYAIWFVPVAFSVLISGDLTLGAKSALLVNRPWLVISYSGVFWFSLAGILVFPPSAILEAIKPETSDVERATLAVLVGVALGICGSLVLIWHQQLRAVRDQTLYELILDDLAGHDDYGALSPRE